MWNLFVYGEKFTDTHEISKQLVQQTGFAPVTDRDVATWATQHYSVDYSKLVRALFEKSSPFESITHAKQRAIAYLKSALSENLEKNNSVFTGLSGHLLPKNFPQIYRIFVTADTSYRLQKAFIGKHMPERQALKEIQREDKKAFRWCRRVYKEAWRDADTYQMVLPSDVLDRQSAVQMALAGFREFMQQPSPVVQQAMKDFQLAAKVEVLMAEKGYPVMVKVENGNAFVTIDKHVLNLSKFSRKVTQTVMTATEVKGVRIDVSPNFNQADLICPTTYETSLETQLSRYEDSRIQLRKQAISAIPARIKNACQRPIQSSLHLRAME